MPPLGAFHSSVQPEFCVEDAPALFLTIRPQTYILVSFGVLGKLAYGSDHFSPFTATVLPASCLAVRPAKTRGVPTSRGVFVNVSNPVVCYFLFDLLVLLCMSNGGNTFPRSPGPGWGVVGESPRGSVLGWGARGQDSGGPRSNPSAREPLAMGRQCRAGSNTVLPGSSH